MPIPFIIGAAAVLAGLAGAGGAISGHEKMKEAKETMEDAKARNDSNMERFKYHNEITTKSMDKLGELELKTAESFGEFADLIERIQNRPDFKTYNRNDVKLPEYNKQDLKDTASLAGAVLSGSAGAVVSGWAASAAATGLVSTFATASTGAAISGLSGAAATNATLAWLGGGSLAAGGGGMALGTAVLGGASLGLGLLVGGFIMDSKGDKAVKQADDAMDQVLDAEKKVDAVCEFLEELHSASLQYFRSMNKVSKIYKTHLNALRKIVKEEEKTNWFDFSDHEQLLVQNAVLLVALLYKMCKVQLVLKTGEDSSNSDRVVTNSVNTDEVERKIIEADKVLADNRIAAIVSV